MATIENRSRTQITVKDRDDLTKLFPHTKNDDARAYRTQLVDAGFKPVVKLLDEAYLVRFVVDGKRRNFTASSEAEATATAKQIEAEHARKLFVDYTAAHHTTLADLLIRYLKEEAPGTKGFLVLAYQINSWLSAAGLPRQDIAEIHRNHPCPYSRDLHIPAPSGRRMSKVGDAARFIRKAFAALKPTDFNNYSKAALKPNADPPSRAKGGHREVNPREGQFHAGVRVSTPSLKLDTRYDEPGVAEGACVAQLHSPGLAKHFHGDYIESLLKVSAGQLNTPVNFELALCGLAGQFWMDTTTETPVKDRCGFTTPVRQREP